MLKQLMYVQLLAAEVERGADHHQHPVPVAVAVVESPINYQQRCLITKFYKSQLEQVEHSFRPALAEMEETLLFGLMEEL